ncbi:exonuclease subunit SbcD [Staphylococcus canis]|uniref:Nuclease SbcCD subunit D n=1 Tax=Staphylococcus canis TaxID=2724942 RepID=A0ABS0TBY8_9STAP|nr:exonuclease subunit SbcD [Staphylococcus canis]MBI5975922.1 exonuclease SbcCD subunit D [Staphylococcus canis]
MKVIHTADWHLGKILNGHSFLGEQELILQQFVEDMKREQPDLVVIAGDIYDTSYPNKNIVTLMEKTIMALNLEMGIPIIMINGNHDSKKRLSYGAQWFLQNGLYIRTELETFFEPIQFENVNFYTLPFFTIPEVKAYFDKDITTYEEALKALIEELRPQLDPAKKNILIGHFTVYGAPKSDSERELTIGTIESVSPDTLMDFDLVLLGHIHHPFTLSSEKIYYSGSIFQYSFSEAGQVKGYRVFDLNQDKISQKFIPLNAERELEVVEGAYSDIINGRFKRKHDYNYFHFKLDALSQITDPMHKLKQVYPNTLSLSPKLLESKEDIQSERHIKKMNPVEIIDTFYEKMTKETLTDFQKHTLIQILNHTEEI